MPAALPKSEGVLRRYAQYLPLTDATPSLTLGEGSTPLVRSRRLVDRIGCAELYFKIEGCNPTGSFKDRGMVVAMAKAIEDGASAVLCASTGNTSASAAAYAAASGVPAYVLVPRGNIALGKLAQAIAYGARVLAIDGNFDDALRIARELEGRHGIALVNSVNPHRIEGQKTAAFEIIEDLGNAPDMLCIPVGNAGNISAYWRGFSEWYDRRATLTPRMMGFQAAGAAPIVEGRPVARPETVASAIRIGNPASWQLAIQARDESGGVIEAVSDEEILEAYGLLAREEGVFGEPASAAGVAGALKLAREGRMPGDAVVVCVITGNGLKDPDTALSIAPDMREVSTDVAAVEALLVPDLRLTP